MKKILFLVPYPFDKAPSQRLKFEQYYTHFKSIGFQIKHDNFISDNFWEIIYKPSNILLKVIYTLQGYWRRLGTLANLRSYDVVYVHLWVTPFGIPFFEWLVCKISKKVIYDIDDLVYLKSNPNENKYLSYLKGKYKPIFLMKNANHIITCTPYLDNFVQKYNKNTTDISSTVDTDNYLPINQYQNEKKIVLGWSGSHSTIRYLYLLKDVLLELKKKCDFKLLVMGTTDFKIDGLDIEVVQWSESIEIPTIQRMDVGLYPLPLNEEWVLGKSGLKAIQYMALGIPTVATNIGCNDRVIQNGVDGFLVKTQMEWQNILMNLISSSMLRQKIGLAARVKIVEHYSIQANKEKYLSILNQMVC